MHKQPLERCSAAFIKVFFKKIKSLVQVSNVFKTQSNIYNGVFLRKQLAVFSRQLFSQNSSIIDLRLSSKYASVSILILTTWCNLDSIGNFIACQSPYRGKFLLTGRSNTSTMMSQPSRCVLQKSMICRRIFCDVSRGVPGIFVQTVKLLSQTVTYIEYNESLQFEGDSHNDLPHIRFAVYKIIANNKKTLIVVFFAQTQFWPPYRSWSFILLENTPGSCPALVIKKLENQLKNEIQFTCLSKFLN